MICMVLAASKNQEQEDAEQEEFLRKETRKKYETKWFLFRGTEIIINWRKNNDDVDE